MSWQTDIIVMEKGRILEVAFDDGEVARLWAELLRVESPSAEVQGHSPSQKTIVTGNVAIVGVEPIGNYAIQIVFDEGHDTGLFSWDHLRGLAQSRQGAPFGPQTSTQRKAGAMTYDFDGRPIEATSSGYLVDQDDWSRGLAEHIASLEHIELGQRHWDLVDYLRDEYFNNNQSTPNTRAILKAMGERWGEKVEQKALYDLFPLDPSKQGGRIAGLPESKRKGGY
jgi:tRNA 2-thiouridine synthesizing protein E